MLRKENLQQILVNEDRFIQPIGHVTLDKLVHENGNRPVTQFDLAIQNAPTLNELDIRILEPHERKDGGAIEYTTLPDTILAWAEDPYGFAKFRFLSETYGIPENDLFDLLDKNGMSDYLKAKSEGRYVGAVCAQIESPTYYFMTNALMLGALSRKGIPTALMMLEYTQDKFYAINSDKRNAFGRIEFPVGVEEKEHEDGTKTKELKCTSIELKPYGIKHDDGTIQRITNINEANGYRCDQVLVQVTDASGPDNQHYYIDSFRRTNPTNNKDSRVTETFYEAALGIEVANLVNTRTTHNNSEVISNSDQHNSISVTDFYRTLWIQTVNRLREAGELPSEEDMPMFFVDGLRLYSVMAESASPPSDVLKELGYGSDEDILSTVFGLNSEDVSKTITNEGGISEYLKDRGLTRLSNGLLVHPNGMPDPGGYYPAQIAWPDMYFECSSCGGDFFVNKLKRAQKARQAYGLPEVEVRLPDVEIPDLERYSIHPSGRYLNIHIERDERVIELNKLIDTFKREFEEEQRIRELKGFKPMFRSVFKELTHGIPEEISHRSIQAKQAYLEKLKGLKTLDFSSTNLYIPESIASLYKDYLSEINQAVASQRVQNTLSYLKRNTNI